MPGISIHVFNKGMGGQDADEMTARMKSDVKPEHAQIVVWQVGTNSAIRRTPLDKFAEKLRAGIDIGHSLGANFVMMNLQYVPAVVALPDEEEYARVMAEVAKEKDAGLFRRFAIMRSWYNDGMPYAQFVTNDGLHLNDFGQKCIGKLLSSGDPREGQSEAIDRRSKYPTLRLSPSREQRGGRPHEAPFRRPVDLSRERRHFRSARRSGRRSSITSTRTRRARSPDSFPA